MKRIHVIARSPAGRIEYIGLFRSAMDAAQDAVKRFGVCGVVVVVIQ